ncbi:P44/Msp2 family outer membrane protein [Neoehrlichia mikurensis]|uniref:P44/Msp2 family outer membrane protein n=1 Tax=Neoehrlichia mikurensis TaxID=89586 RepID=A0ABY5EYM9_9RICK|nr:P44/Msp2 family outer membrane protein [Neoehrlichia mikurensis]
MAEASFDFNYSNKCTLKNAYKYFAAAAKLKAANNDEIDAPTDANENHNKYYYVIKNSNISAAATMINLCYDFTSDALGNGEISPYLCAGVGASLVKALNMPHVKFSYQAKAGVNYFLSNSVAIFADAYYHATHDNTFITPVIHKPIKFANQNAQADHNKFTDDHVDLSVKADSIDIKAILALKADAAAVENPGATNTPSEVSKFIQKPDNFKGFYKPTYNNSFAGFSGLIGYSTPNGVRLELEGSFENFELKNSNKCTLKNAYKYFAAAAKLKADKNDEIDDAAAGDQNHNKYLIIIMF